MKKIILYTLIVITCVNIFPQETTETTKTKVNETEITEEFYSESTIVSANKIHYLYPNYKATPGDVYDIVYLLPSMNESNTIAGFVDNNYEIDLAFIGKVNVKGLIYTEIQEILKSHMQKAYPGAIVNIIIKSTGLFKVTLIGEVNRSYILDAMSLTTLEQIISGKTTKYASIRDIEIRSEDGSIKHYDLFKFKRFADKNQNPFLKPNDVITIKPYEKKIKITGAVKRPGTYEILQGDNLSDIINLYADGYTKLADNSRILIQKKLSKDGAFDDKNLIIDANKRNLTLITLDDYDSINIPSQISYNSNISVNGEINKPGTYELIDGTNLYDLIYVHGDGFNKVADRSRIILKRKLDINDNVNLESVILDEANDDFKEIILRDFDSVIIPKVFTENQNIILSGQTKKTGKFVLSDKDTLYDLIHVYGYGFDKFADTTRITITSQLDESGNPLVEREKSIINANNDDLRKIFLSDLDHVNIPRLLVETKSVKLSGQVKKSGTFILSDGDTLYDLIEVFGYGFSKFADITRISITSQLDESDKPIVERENSIINAEEEDLKSIYLSDLDHVYIPRLLVETKKVKLTGQVKKTGDFILSEGDTLYDLIEVYGYGFNEFADSTRITVVSMIDDSNESDREKTVYNTTEDDLKMVLLKNMDSVYIPRVKLDIKKVSIAGQVDSPGTYMLVEDDTLFELIETYGYGYTKFAEISKIEIQRRINDDDQYEESTLYIDANKTDLKTIKLQDFDKVFIPNKVSYSPVVTFQGAISSTKDSIEDDTILPGSSVSNKIAISIIKGNKLSTALAKLTGDFTLSSDLENSFILRGSEKISIDIKDVMTNVNSEYDVVLQDEDIIIVPFKQLKVFVGGSVNAGGAIPFIENRTARYYIGLAGGYKRTENLFGTYTIRDVYGNKVDNDAIISPEDVIWVNRDHPMSYIEEYAGWITTIVSTIVLSYKLTDLASTIN